MEQADRERLKCLRAYCTRFTREGKALDPTVDLNLAMDGREIASIGCGIDNGEMGVSHLRHDWARQEIARLEALEHAEAAVVPDGGWHTIGSINSAGIITKPGDIVSVDLLAQTWEVRPSAYEPSEPTEQRLDDFMREQERKRRREYLAEAWPMNEEPEDHDEQQPASRELVERMVREATSHSLWPVTMEVPDPREPTGYHAMFHRPDGRFAIALEYGALSHHAAGEAESMATLIEACARMRVCVSHYNSLACPACNGSAKVRGYFFGEKQCPDCEGTGVR